MERFTEPFNWCDYSCEVCPLAGECRLNIQNEQRRWVHKARGMDPDDPVVAAADFERTLDHTLEIIREIALEEGIDPDAPLPPPEPVSLAARRLEKASKDYVQSIVRAVQNADTTADGALEAIDTVRNRSFVVGGKIARLRSHFSPEGEVLVDEALWVCSGVPTLLLIEHADAEIAREMPKLVPREDDAAKKPPKLALVPRNSRSGASGHLVAESALGFEQARAAMWHALGPLLERIDDDLRQELARMVREKRAPSPFVRVGPKNPEADDSLLV